MSGVSGNSLDHAAIAARIPHAGSMCLLDEVVRWDADAIDCRARSHRDPANPLRSREQLAAVHGVEYAAQAMALHGALLSGVDAPASRPGYIGAVRALELHAPRLDDIAGDLAVHAERLVGDASHVLYAFNIRAGARLLVEGRISVALGAAT
jgi:predicted hotdog family 3-hydroxylacyl-ACP dehydratase